MKFIDRLVSNPVYNDTKFGTLMWKINKSGMGIAEALYIMCW